MAYYFHIRFFGLKAFGSYMGVERTLNALALGMSAPIVGYAYDTTGNYIFSYWGMALVLFFGAAIYMFLGKYRFEANIGETRVPAKP